MKIIEIYVLLIVLLKEYDLRSLSNAYTTIMVIIISVY